MYVLPKALSASYSGQLAFLSYSLIHGYFLKGLCTPSSSNSSSNKQSDCSELAGSGLHVEVVRCRCMCRWSDMGKYNGL